jgi:hypothetical protein
MIPIRQIFTYSFLSFIQFVVSEDDLLLGRNVLQKKIYIYIYELSCVDCHCIITIEHQNFTNANKLFCVNYSEHKVINRTHSSARCAICTATGAHPNSFKQL